METRVKTWTRDGWNYRPVGATETFGGLRSHVSYGDNEYSGGTNEMSVIQDIHNEILYGPIGSYIDELPAATRDIFQQPYVWHVVNTRLFKITDPETQVYENGDWGTDADDREPDVGEEQVTTTRLFLEHSGILPSEPESKDITDILGSVTERTEVLESPCGQRLDTDVAQLHGSDLVAQHPANDTLVNMPELPASAITAIHKIRKEFIKLLAGATEETEETLRSHYELALDREINKYLTYSLNSPYCGHRYSPPRPVYKFITIPKDSEVSAAAAERQAFFRQLFVHASECCSMQALYGSFVLDNNKKAHRPGGFMGYIRGMYQHDKALASEWSIFNRTDAGDNVIQLSAFNTARQAFATEWRTQESGDEESLRIAMWNRFDRVAAETDAVYDSGGKLKTSRRKQKDSIWRQQRTTALQDLFLTRAQWDSVYTMVNTVKARLRLQVEPTVMQKDTLETLRVDFCKITNLRDLYTHMEETRKRKFLTTRVPYGYKTKANGNPVFDARGLKVPKLKVIPSYKFELSLIDQLSFFNETQWLAACAKKRKSLQNQLVVSNLLRAQVQDFRAGDWGEQFIPCGDPQCDCMAIGIPRWYRVQDDRGLLGIPCDGCKKIVWCLEDGKMPEPKTYKQMLGA